MEVSSSDVTFLQYLSSCLHVFRRKITFLTHIQKSSHQNQFNLILEESFLLLQQFSQFFVSQEKMEMTFPRFVTRVKEIVTATRVNKCSEDLSQYINGLLQYTNNNSSHSKYRQILQYMLIKLPKNSVYCKQVDEKLTDSMLDNKKPLQQTILEVKKISFDKKYKNPQTFEKFIAALERDYLFLSPMNFDQQQYRRIFFISRRDYHKKDGSLYDDMILRNKISQSQILNYGVEHEKYIQRKKNKKKRVIEFDLKQMNEKNSQTLKCCKDFERDKTILEKSKASSIKNATIDKKNEGKRQKTKTQHSLQKQKQINLKDFHSFKMKKSSSNFCHAHRQKMKTSLEDDQRVEKNQIFHTRSFHTDKQKITKIVFGGNVVQLKKINFLGSRIELMPEHQEKKNKDTDLRKNLNRRAHQHVKKKISQIIQQKAVETKPKQKNEKNKAPLIIGFSKLGV